MTAEVLQRLENRDNEAQIQQAQDLLLDDDDIYSIRLLVKLYNCLDNTFKLSVCNLIAAPISPAEFTRELYQNISNTLNAIEGSDVLKENIQKAIYLLREFCHAKALMKTLNAEQPVSEDLLQLVSLCSNLERIFIKKEVVPFPSNKEHKEILVQFETELKAWIMTDNLKKSEAKRKAFEQQQKEAVLAALQEEEQARNAKIEGEKLQIALSKAVSDCKPDVAKDLFHKIRQLVPQYDFNSPIAGFTLFHYSDINRGYHASIQLLLFKEGIRLLEDIQYMHYLRLMRDAILLNDLETFKKILSHAKQHKDFDINLADLSNLRLIQYAIMLERTDFSDLLLKENGIDLTVKMPKTHSSVLDLCLKSKTDVVHRPDNIIPPKTNRPNTAIAEMLLLHIQKNGLQKDFSMTQHLADVIKIPSLRIAELLIGMGADVNAPLSSGRNPTPEAIEQIYSNMGGVIPAGYSIQGQSELIKMVNLFIRSGADLQVNQGKNVYGDTQSILGVLSKYFRMSDWQFDGLLPSVKEDWQTLKTIVLAAHRNDLGNHYVDSKERAEDANAGLLTRSLLSIDEHNADLMQIDGYKVELERHSPGITGEEIIRSYNEVFMQDIACRRDLHQITQDILIAAGKPNPMVADRIELISLVQANLSSFGQIEGHAELSQANFKSAISVVPTLTTINDPGDHAMTYLLHNDLCVRINCGATAKPDDKTTTGGITIYRILDKKTLYDVWGPRLLNSPKVPVRDSALVGELLEECCDPKPIARIEMDKQRVGNCAWKSTEAGLRAIILVNIYKTFKQYSPKLSDEQCFKQAEKYSELWLSLFIMRDRQLALEDCNKPAAKKVIPKSLYTKVETGARIAKQRYEGLCVAHLREKTGAVQTFRFAVNNSAANNANPIAEGKGSAKLEGRKACRNDNSTPVISANSAKSVVAY